ncbi:MAG: radical SAM protein [Actinomycetota bacterium]|nr:radical SAM protein [Actinomycetota bacterium]
MRVALIYPDYYHSGCIEGEPQGRVHLGSGYLSAVLKRAGHDVAFLHLLEPTDRDAFLEWLTAQDAGLVAFSTTSLMFPKVRRMARWVKEETGLPVVTGGVHPTLDPLGTLEETSIDLVCVGEGEAALLELVEALEGRGEVDAVPSLMGRWRGREFANPVQPLLEDLDSLPFPDRSIFDMSRLAPDQRERITVMASRGCPYRCRYCSNHAQRSVYPDGGRYVRFRSVDNVLTEIEELAAHAEGVDHVRFDDDILTLRPAWFQEFVREYPRRVDLPFICNSRVDLLDEEKIAALKEAGCKTICMGIESGNPWLRKNVLGRRMSDQRILDAFRLCRKYGIGTVSLNMMGFPQEDFSMVLDTVKLNGRARPGITQITVFYPFPGTELYRDCREKGLFVDEDTDTLFTRRSALRLEGISEEQMELVSEYFTVLAWLYHGIFTLPDALSRPLERLTDQALSSGLIPHAWKKKACKRLLSRLPWEWYMTTKY